MRLYPPKHISGQRVPPGLDRKHVTVTGPYVERRRVSGRHPTAHTRLNESIVVGRDDQYWAAYPARVDWHAPERHLSSGASTVRHESSQHCVLLRRRQMIEDECTERRARWMDETIGKHGGQP